MLPFAGMAVLAAMLLVGLFLAALDFAGYVACSRRAKRAGRELGLWERILLRAGFLAGAAIALFPILFCGMLLTQNRKLEERAAIRFRLEQDAACGELQTYLEREPRTGFRLRAAEAAAGARFYVLEETRDGGASWGLVNGNPFGGRLGLASGIVFVTRDTGAIGMTDAAGGQRRVYVTCDGGASFSEADRLPAQQVRQWKSWP